MKYQPVVSIVVVTYNSSQFILETLESITNQSYKNIELIISDDCSSDNTWEICEEWIKNNKKRFLSVQILSTIINSGVVVNLNNGCKAASGEWIKSVAGDDILAPNCITDYIEYISQYHIDTICCSKSASFIEESGKIRITNVKPDPYTKHIFFMNAKKQYKYMLLEYVILLPLTAIINKKIFSAYGYYDEKFPYIEDQPFFLKLSKNGIKIHYNDNLVSYYHRTNINSASQTTNGMMNRAAFCRGGILFQHDKMFVLPYVKRYHVIFYYHFYLDLFRRYVVVDLMDNKVNFFNNLLNRFFLLLDPVFVKKWIYNILHRNI